MSNVLLESMPKPCLATLNPSQKTKTKRNNTQHRLYFSYSWSIDEFITPERFAEYKELGLKMGFKYVESGPLVRSSYRAEKHLF